MYAFRPDWTGEVVAEAAGDEPKYLGLRFPASDIPSQARALYTTCRLRALRTSTYRPAALVAQADQPPIDLSHAVLRSVSPVHLEYMRNMGVTASLGLSLVIDHQLWGLITCNHETGDRWLPCHERMGCALIGEVVASLIGQQARLDAAQAQVIALSTQAKLLRLVAQDRDLVTGLMTHSPSLLDLVPAAGAALLFEDALHCIGTTPPVEELPALLGWLDGQAGPIVHFESLPAHYAAAHAWRDVGCGLLAARISFGDSIVVTRPIWLLWFRPELLQVVVWGGDPHKVAAAEPQARLSPRTSFARWREIVELRSEPFPGDQLDAAVALTAGLSDVILEIAATRKLQEAARLLEDSHRSLVQQIEETARAEVELRRAQKLEAVGRLAAGIAHEINTPLQFIQDSIAFVAEAIEELLSIAAASQGAAGGVDLEYLKRNLPGALGRTREGLDRVSTVVNALTEFAQADAVDKSPADLNHALMLATEIARGVTQRCATITLSLGEVPAFPCFASQLNQLFLNLIVNAAEAIEETLGPVRTCGAISITSWRDEASAFVAITDDGAGIPEAIRDSVFLPFFTTKQVGSGTGGGLAVCHAIAAKHGGSLTFDSTMGRGTTFTLRLPM